jgi:hypothetical protein
VVGISPTGVYRGTIPMSNQTRSAVTVAVGLSLLLVAGGFAQSGSSPNSLHGVWKVTDVTTTGPTGSRRESPQPGFYVFTGKYYSVSTVNSDAPRPELPADVTTATADQLRAAWNPFTGQAGTYEVKGAEVTMHPLAAKNPAAMKAGNFNVSTFRIEGTTLTLVSKATQAGPANNPTTTKLTRVE